jgi:predicted acylesterase/phospholipase RssA
MGASAGALVGRLVATSAQHEERSAMTNVLAARDR